MDDRSKKEKDQKSRVLLLSKSQPQVGEHVVLHSNWNPNGELQGVKIQKDGQCMRMLAHGPKSQHEVRGGRSPRRKGPDMSTIDPADADSRLSAFHERRQIQSKIKYFQSWLSGNHLKNVKNQIYRHIDKRKPMKPALLNPALGKFGSQHNQSKMQGLQDAAFRAPKTATGITSAEATGFCEPKLKIEGAKANARYAESADASNVDASDPKGASLGPPSIDTTAQEVPALQKVPQE